MLLTHELLMEKSKKENRKVTQAEAAEACDLNPPTFYMLLTGKMSGIRSDDDLKRIARYFGKTIDWLKNEIATRKEG